MKTQSTHFKRILPFLGILLICLKALSQTNSKNEFTAFWPNGDVTRQADLGQVWIIKTNGKIVKEAKIREYHKAKGKLVYERERTLHDIETFNIKSITKSSNCAHHIYFDKEGNPMVTKNPEYAFGYDNSDFKKSELASSKQAAQTTTSSSKAENVQRRDSISSKHTPKLTVDTAIVLKKVIAPVAYSSTNTYASVCDTVVKSDGTRVLVKILELSEFEIRYKRMDYLTGPVYNLIIKPETKVIQYEKSRTVIIN